MTTVVVSVDRIPVGMLGPYGGEWVETPTLDRLASGGVTFHRARAATVEAGANLGALAEVLTQHANLAPRIGIFSGRTDLPAGLVQRLSIEALEDEPDSPLEAVFAAGLDWLTRRRAESPLLWLDLALAGAGWTPPVEWRGRHLEEESEDTEPLEPVYRFDACAVEPHSTLTEQVRLGWADRVAYFDALLGVFLEGVRETVGEQAVVAFVAELGEPLGEQVFLGPHPEALFAARTNLPLLVSGPGVRRTAPRQEFVTVRDLAQFAAGRLTDSPTDNPIAEAAFGRASVERWYHFTRAGATRILETGQWKLVAAPTGDRLFVKPEDLWDANDVAMRRPNEVEALRAIIRQLETTAP